jgi:hypothetical protein
MKHQLITNDVQFLRKDMKVGKPYKMIFFTEICHKGLIRESFCWIRNDFTIIFNFFNTSNNIISQMKLILRAFLRGWKLLVIIDLS